MSTYEQRKNDYLSFNVNKNRELDICIVALTTFDNDYLVFNTIRAGAHACLLKDAIEAEVESSDILEVLFFQVSRKQVDSIERRNVNPVLQTSPLGITLPS